MQNPRSRSQSSSKGRPAVVSCGVIGLAGLVLVGMWWTAAMKTPKVDIPKPVVPNPNAFDFYVKAGTAITGDTQIGNAIGSKPTLVLTLAQKEALVQQNLGAINTLHQGFAYPYVDPSGRSINTSFAYYAKYRSMARLLSLQGKVQAEQGDWGGSVDSQLDAVRLGEDVPHNSVLIGYLVGVACQAIGRKPIWNSIEHLNAAQSRAAAIRLESIMDRHFSFADTLQEEKYFGQAAMLEMFADPKKMKASLAPDAGINSGEEQSGAAAAQSLSILFYLAYSKSRIMNGYTTYMDKSSQIARQPYGLHLPPPPMPKDPINSVLMPVFLQARLKGVDSETQNGLLLVLLALHAFQLEHGHYPATLAELAPTYLKKIPNDPFAVQETFKYILKGNTYTLYSVGPDGKDNGGKAIDDTTQIKNGNPKARYFVNPNSVGDVVAGKNIY